MLIDAKPGTYRLSVIPLTVFVRVPSAVYDICLYILYFTPQIYDYLVTFPMEMEYIWKHSKSWVTFLLLFTRYSPIYDIIFVPLVGE